MSDNLAVLSRVIARLNAGMVLAAFLLLAHGINSSTECWGNDISVVGNGRPTGEVGTSQIDRHVFGEDASHSSAFGYLDFDWTSDPRGEPRHENVPTHEGTARAEGLMNSILNWLTANFDLPVVRDTPRIELAVECVSSTPPQNYVRFPHRSHSGVYRKWRTLNALHEPLL